MRTLGEALRHLIDLSGKLIEAWQSKNLHDVTLYMIERQTRHAEVTKLLEDQGDARIRNAVDQMNAAMVELMKAYWAEDQNKIISGLVEYYLRMTEVVRILW